MIVDAPDFEVLRKSDPDYKPGAFRLTSRMLYTWRAKGCYVEVPEGTITDFASIPRGFRNLVSINGAHRLPAVLHDFLYAKAGLLDNAGTVTRYSRKDADKVFYEAMRREGVPRWKASVMYRAVRVFGGIHLKLTGSAGF